MRKTFDLIIWLVVGWMLALVGWEILQRSHFAIPQFSIWELFR